MLYSRSNKHSLVLAQKQIWKPVSRTEGPGMNSWSYAHLSFDKGAKEMGKWTEQSFLKGRSPNGQNTHEEMHNIPGHKGNTYQNHIKIAPHSC
jgi:hypothetical protein